MKKAVQKSVAKAVVKEVPKAEFHASLKMGDKVFEAQGETIDDAISKLNPSLIKTRCLITIRQGDKKAEKMLKGMFVKRLLFYKTYRAIYSKQLGFMLK